VSTLTIAGLQSPCVALSRDAIIAKSIVIDACKLVVTVTSDEQAKIAGSALVDIAGLVKECEKSRKTVKDPILTLGRQIDEVAKEYSTALELESTRIRGLVGAYNAKVEEERRLAEAKRQAELQRIENERIEAERKQREEAARIERERVAAEQEANRKAYEALEAAKTKEDAGKVEEALRIESERAAAAAESNRIAAEKEAKERADQFERLRQQAILDGARSKPVAVEGVSVSSVWKYEVTDIRKVYTFNPELVELTPKAREINAAIKAGHRNIPGLRIWEEKGVKVRA